MVIEIQAKKTENFYYFMFQEWPAFVFDYDCIIHLSGITVRNAHCPDRNCGTRTFRLKAKLTDGPWLLNKLFELPDPRQYETVPLGKT